MSPIDVDRLGFELQKHPDRHFVEYLLSGLRFGFDTMVSTLELPIIECKNLVLNVFYQNICLQQYLSGLLGMLKMEEHQKDL
jgi:hypothetical protein